MRLPGHARSDDRRHQGRRTADVRKHHQGCGPQPQRHRRRDHRRLRQDRHAGAGQRPHAHLGNRAARHRRGVDVGGLFQARAFQSRDALQTRGQLHRQPDGRARADRRGLHHAGRLVPQHHLHRARRARGGRPDRQRHPRGVRARHRETDRARERHAVHPRAASARADRGAAQGQALRATTRA